MNSIDALMSFFIFITLFIFIKSIIDNTNTELSLYEKSNTLSFDPIRVFCFPGDSALWDVSSGYAGFGKYYNFCTLEKRKLDYFISLLSIDNNKAKEMLGIGGKNITLTITDTNGTIYYNYIEPMSNDKEIYTVWGTYNNRPVKINMQISS